DWSFFHLGSIEAAVGQAETLLDREQVRALLLRDKGDGRAQLRCEQQGPAVSLEYFSVPLGMSDCIGPADNSVVPKKDCVVFFYEGQHRLCKLRCSRSLVRRDRDLADEDFEFRNDHVRRHSSGNRVGGCMRRMAVHDGFGLWHFLIDFKMQEDFAGARLGSGNLFSIEIDQGEVLGRKVILAYQGWRADDLIG